MSIQKVRDFITKAKLGKALEMAAKLPEVLQDEFEVEDTVIMLTGSYHQNERGLRMGIVTRPDYNSKIANINYQLLGILNELEDAKEEEEEEEKKDTKEEDTKEEDVLKPPQKPEPIDDGITKILFLASNPSDTAKLQLTTEHSRVSIQLQNAPAPENFPIKFHQAVTPSQFSKFLFLEKPDIVHFSGHGDRKAPEFQKLIQESRAGRDEPEENKEEKDEAGIFLMDEDQRSAHFVSTRFLKRTFETIVKRLEIPVKVVVFNACHSAEQAKAISETVPYVVGTSWSVGDKAAIAFASGFYFGIAQNMDIEDAFNFGIDQSLAFNEPEDKFLLYKDGKKVEW